MTIEYVMTIEHVLITVLFLGICFLWAAVGALARALAEFRESSNNIQSTQRQRLSLHSNNILHIVEALWPGTFDDIDNKEDLKLVFKDKVNPE